MIIARESADPGHGGPARPSAHPGSAVPRPGPLSTTPVARRRRTPCRGSTADGPGIGPGPDTETGRRRAKTWRTTRRRAKTRARPARRTVNPAARAASRLAGRPGSRGFPWARAGRVPFAGFGGRVTEGGGFGACAADTAGRNASGLRGVRRGRALLGASGIGGTRRLTSLASAPHSVVPAATAKPIFVVAVRRWRGYLAEACPSPRHRRWRPGGDCRPRRETGGAGLRETALTPGQWAA